MRDEILGKDAVMSIPMKVDDLRKSIGHKGQIAIFLSCQTIEASQVLS
jgi:hypothetical protein